MVDAIRKTVSQYCENHHGERKAKRFFCENCGYPICSDCSVIDAVHEGHTFVRLKDAARRQTDSLQNLFKEGKKVESQYEVAIQQTEVVEKNLEHAAIAAKEAIHRAKINAIQQLDDVVTRHEQDINNTKDERRSKIDPIKGKLKCELATLKSVLDHGKAVVYFGSEYEITSSYSSLSAKLQQLINTQPMAADNKLSHIEFETPKISITSIRKYSCKKQKTTPTKSSVGNQESFATAPHSSPISAAKVLTKPNLPSTTTMHNQPGKTDHIKIKQSPRKEVVNSGSENGISTNPSLSAKQQKLVQTQPKAPDRKPSHVRFKTSKNKTRSIGESSSKKRKTAHTKSSVGNQATTISTQPNLASTTMNHQHGATNHIKIKQSPAREILRKQWKECGQIKTTPQVDLPLGVAIQSNGDIAVTSMYVPVTVFSRNGDVKFVVKDSPTDADDIAITPNNQYIIPGMNQIYIYDSQGIQLSTTPTYDVNNQPSRPNSVAVDSRGRIIVGLGQNGRKTVCIHQPDGKLISKFATPESPRKIACTPDDELIISFNDSTLQVMDQSGHKARIIQSLSGIKYWWPGYVCCGKQGELFVGSRGVPMAVYRYVSTGTGYKYASCVVIMGRHEPHGIALSANEEELFVVNNQAECIQIFQC